MGAGGVEGGNGLWRWGRGALHQDLPQVTSFSATGGAHEWGQYGSHFPGEETETELGVKLKAVTLSNLPVLPLLSDFTSELWTALLRAEDSGSQQPFFQVFLSFRICFQ